MVFLYIFKVFILFSKIDLVVYLGYREYREREIKFIIELCIIIKYERYYKRSDFLGGMMF